MPGVYRIRELKQIKNEQTGHNRKNYSNFKRKYEIGIKLPEEIKTIHEIETDDPSGIEAYWYNRFRNKRKQGEWFDLSYNDVKVFKRWKRIV